MQFSRIEQRVPAIDLSGPKAFVESLTPRSNLTVIGMVDFVSDLSDLFSFVVAHSSALLPGQGTPDTQSGGVLLPVWVASIIEASTLSEGLIRGGNRKNRVHAPLDSLLRGVEGSDEQE